MNPASFTSSAISAAFTTGLLIGIALANGWISIG